MHTGIGVFNLFAVMSLIPLDNFKNMKLPGKNMTAACFWKGMRKLQEPAFMLCPDISLLLWVFHVSSCTP
jgi:hypothetical protein